MTESTLLKSWATPPARRPTASIFCACRSCPSSRRRSLTSSAVPCSWTTAPLASRWPSTTICTSIRQPAEGRRHRFSWINEWKETADANGRPFGIELILPDWFYAGVIDDALVLTIDRAYFELTGGLERWLYRLVRKHGGRQDGGWSFDLVHLHAKSGILSPLKHFAYDVRQIVQRQTLPGYQLVLTRDPDGTERLNFAPTPVDPLTARLRRRGLIPNSEDNL